MTIEIPDNTLRAMVEKLIGGGNRISDVYDWNRECAEMFSGILRAEIKAACADEAYLARLRDTVRASLTALATEKMHSAVMALPRAVVAPLFERLAEKAE